MIQNLQDGILWGAGKRAAGAPGLYVRAGQALFTQWMLHLEERPANHLPGSESSLIRYWQVYTCAYAYKHVHTLFVYHWDKHDSPRKLSIQFDSNLPHETPKHHVKEVPIQQETTCTGCARSRSLSSTGKAGTGVMGSSWQREGCKPHCILLDTTHRMLARYLQHTYFLILWSDGHGA